MSTTTSTAKVAGSVVVVGVAVAVAGLSSFGQFTGSTEAVDAGVDTGVLSIDVSAAGTSAPVPVTTATLMPGDVGYFPMDLRNGGTVDLSSVTLVSSAAVSSRLDSDPVHGLQLEVDTCETAWVRSGAAWSCAAGADPLYAGPIAASAELLGAHSLAAGATDHLLATVSFPTTGGDAMQNQKSTLEFVFTAAQRDGGSR
ncbi:hypothetical protein [Blastococcus goldschmidtiae]|uniref:Camelysin metallo-endopeptidase n=1 Tax=Blastococcus goldschmidtiae TaxID=3075546 RepID=A0ABU2KAX4_9ACTN|nr:hypothetical protein [Blastococcus sp. DSM 46792]MDT0277342.1 hypothetical protein [Blastococcus sp. DSM 46792]